MRRDCPAPVEVHLRSYERSVEVDLPVVSEGGQVDAGDGEGFGGRSRCSAGSFRSCGGPCERDEKGELHRGVAAKGEEGLSGDAGKGHVYELDRSSAPGGRGEDLPFGVAFGRHPRDPVQREAFGNVHGAGVEVDAGDAGLVAGAGRPGGASGGAGIAGRACDGSGEQEQSGT